ncbi:MAG: threonylcarbamoyl-AMP synthase [Ruminococcaceae bacterium]|nr:threonylcarbamoyl-AMP synthase [Oscillospiraceae bacterium]
MQTELLTASAEGVARAGALLRRGEVVGIPTETVYGLAADALNPSAVMRIFEAKGRPSDNPLIVHIAARAQLDALVTEVPAAAERLASLWWPGPLTMIFKKAACVPSVTSGGLSTVAVRLPAHPTARAVIEAAGCPLAAPSANRSGSPSPTTAAHVTADMDGRVAAILDGGASGVGVESTVVDMTREVPRLLRPGGITVEMLREAVGEVEVDPAVTAMLEQGVVAASPGMKYKHYAPRANVTLVRSAAASYAAFVNAHAGEGVAAMCFDGEEAALTVPYRTYGARDDAAAQARRVFDVLRGWDDDPTVTQVYAACPSSDGLGLAVYNRLLRAAEFEVIVLDD